MQPSTAGGVGGVSRVRADVQETPLNVEGWWRRGESGVAPDQVCCHSANETLIRSRVLPLGIFPAILRPEAWEGAGEGGQSGQAEGQLS